MSIDLCFDNLIEFEDQVTKPVVPRYTEKYDNITTNTYRMLRQLRYDPFDHTEVMAGSAFEFPWMWDPYTGERKDADPFGPLCFNCTNLTRFFNSKKLDGLWNAPKDETGGYYSGYYDCMLGSGPNICIKSRGTFPEKYLFRLPVIDCYLTDDHNMSVPTMGPVLTDDDIAEIDKKNTNKKIDLVKIKKYYDMAISDNKDIIEDAVRLMSEKEKIKYESAPDKLYAVNSFAVDRLKAMQGIID